MARFVKAILFQEGRHLKSYLKIMIQDQASIEDANSVLWMLSATSHLTRLSPRQKFMAHFLHNLLFNHDKLPWDLTVPDDVAATILGPLLPNTVNKALSFTERVWFPEIKRTYMQYAAQFNPNDLKELAAAMNYYVVAESYYIANRFELGTFYPLWKLCRGGH